MRIHSYVGGILVKLLAIILMFTGFLIFLYAGGISQQTGAPIELYWIVSWIIFILGLVVFATGIIVQRRALRRMKGQMRDASRLEFRRPHIAVIFLRQRGMT